MTEDACFVVETLRVLVHAWYTHALRRLADERSLARPPSLDTGVTKSEMNRSTRGTLSTDWKCNYGPDFIDGTILDQDVIVSRTVSPTTAVCIAVWYCPMMTLSIKHFKETHTAPFPNVFQPLFPWSTRRRNSFHRSFHHHECQLTCTYSHHFQ